MACTQILLPTGPLLLRVRPFDFWGGYGWFQKKNILQTDFEGKNSCLEILYLAKKDSYTEKTIFRGVWLWKKILQRGRCMSGRKFYHQRVWGKNSFPAKSPIPPTEPHPLPINVKWSAIPSVPSVPLLLGSSVPSLPNVPLFHAPLVSYPASIACERQTFLLALIFLEGRSQRR